MGTEKVSIITVCYNAENTIASTIESVINQNYRPLQYIIIDGMSEDNTVHIIKEYEKELEDSGIEAIIVSEKDLGIYNAMNKGIKMASGEWINFMNADDRFYASNVISNILEQIPSYVDIVYGDEMIKDASGKVCINRRNGEIENICKTLPFCHQSSFTRKKWFQQHLFDESLKIVADYEFFLYCYTNHAKFHYFNTIIAEYYSEGTSRQLYKKAIDESFKVKSKYGYINEKSIVAHLKKELRKIYTTVMLRRKK